MTAQRKNYYSYVIFSFLLLFSTWQFHSTNSSLISMNIPNDAIRLRILAHSDRPQDQNLKLAIRDAVITKISTWVGKLTHIKKAREKIRLHISEIEQLVESYIQAYGFDYSYHVELARVAFPTKFYGNLMYPAGMYEALRISIGEGQGNNWWCVLFPPLCFVDAISGKKLNTSAVLDQISNKNSTQYRVVQQDKESVSIKNEKIKENKPRIRFFLWEKCRKWFKR
jgi:stage II sporulation protein R